MKALEVDNLEVNFGGLKAITGVSLSVDMGERRGIIGCNGAGKTTFFNTVCGYVHLSAGNIFLFGRKVTRMSPHHRVTLGLGRTFQKMNTFLNLTVIENIRLALGQKRLNFGTFFMTDKSIGLKSDELLQKFSLYEKRHVLLKNLSYGEQRIVEIALALASEPRLLLLDEPCGGLSPSEVNMILAMMRQLPQNITVIIIEHDMDVIFRIAERITVLHFGKVLADGSKEDIGKNEQVKEIYLGRGETA